MNEERATEHPDEDLLAAWILEGEEPEGIGDVLLHVGECRVCAARVASLRRLSGALEAAAHLESAEATAASPAGASQPWRLRWRSLARARRRSDVTWAIASLASVALVALSVPRSGGPSGPGARGEAGAEAARRRLVEAISKISAARLDSLLSLPLVAAAVSPFGEPPGALEAAYEMDEAERESLQELLRERLGGSGQTSSLDRKSM